MIFIVLDIHSQTSSLAVVPNFELVIINVSIADGAMKVCEMMLRSPMFANDDLPGLTVRHSRQPGTDRC